MLNLIEGKRVIFVGACPNIKGLGLGEYIDGFDVVVRANGSHMIIDEYKEDYGSRSDIIYFNVQHAREMFPLPSRKYRDDGVKRLCFKNLSNRDKLLYSQYIPCRTIEHIIEEVHKIVHGALMGLFIFEDIISFNPSEFIITGIDFFQSKKQVFEVDNYQEYLDGYLPPKIIKQGNQINLGKTKDGHNQKTNTEYIKKLYDQKKLDFYPEFIKEIMEDII